MNDRLVLVFPALMAIAGIAGGCGGGDGQPDLDADAAGDDAPDAADDAQADGDGTGDEDAPPDINPDAPITCEGNCHYVREGAAGRGDGSDWDNAWTALPDTLQRGHHYFIADGSYPAYEFDDPESGGDVITIQKAVPSSAACTSAAGWDDGYGDAAAVMPAIAFFTGNYVFDGAVGEGTSGHGFDLYDESPPETNVSLVAFAGNVRHVLILRTSMHRPSRDHKGTGVYATLGGDGDIVFSRCYIHDLFGVHFFFVDTSTITIEHSVMARNLSTMELYTESIQAGGVVGLIVRYCRFEDIQGTGVIVNENGASADWELYGNVFNGFDARRGSVADNMSGSITGVKVYNNTVVNATGYGGVRFAGSTGGNSVIDNIFYGCALVFHEGADYDYNYYSSCTFPYAFLPGPSEPPKDASDTHTSINDDPFTGSASGDFHLLAPLDGYPGMALDPPYDVDFDGVARGSDGVWDRGAFEFAQ